MKLADRPSTAHPVVKEYASHTLSELNQSTYERLRLSQSLNLRRQIFLAICDDLELRNHLSAELCRDLAHPVSQPVELPLLIHSTTPVGNPEGPATRHSDLLHPHVVSLVLNLSHPDPIAQVAQWLKQHPTTQGLPNYFLTFQILGVECLTRQPSSIQRQFLNHLEQLGRSLSSPKHTLLLWLTRPWFHAIQQSAPAFWSRYTAVFEFEGDPTPSCTPIETWDTSTSSGVPATLMPAKVPARPDRPRSSAGEIDRLQSTIVGPGGPPKPTAPNPKEAGLNSFKRSSEIPADALTPDAPSEAAFTEVAATTTEAQPELGEGDTNAQNEIFWEILTQDLASLSEQDQNLILESEIFRLNQSFTSVLAFDRAEGSDSAVNDPSLLNSEDSIKNHPAESHEAPDTTTVYEPVETVSSLNQLGDHDLESQKLAEPFPNLSDQEQEALLQQEKVNADTSTLKSLGQNIHSSTLHASRYSLSALAHLVEAAIQPGSTNQKSLQDAAALKALEHIQQLQQLQADSGALAIAYQTLGNLYRDRIEQGDQTEKTLMVAICAYEQTLVYLEDSSLLWSDLLNDIGNLYWMLSRSASTVELALPYLDLSIAAYQLALRKTDVQTQPQSYAMIQNNLGAAYGDLARHRDAEHTLQLSVQAYQEALRYRTSEDEAARYAATQNNLGAAYWNLAQYQQPALRLQQAIAAYREALHYYSHTRDSLHYAMIQNNLGTAYWNLAQYSGTGENAIDSSGAFSLLTQAIESYQAALVYRTLEVFPSGHAATQNNLGTAYWQLATLSSTPPEVSRNFLQQAIAAYQSALAAVQYLQAAGTSHAPALTFDPLATHNNLGLAYYQLVITQSDQNTQQDNSAQRSNHLVAALEHHLQALEGWVQQPELHQAAFSHVVHIIRTFYSEFGTQGQNLALSKVPASLLPELINHL